MVRCANFNLSRFNGGTSLCFVSCFNSGPIVAFVLTWVSGKKVAGDRTTSLCFFNPWQLSRNVRQSRSPGSENIISHNEV